ncbi:MAG: M20/M25/M40 family metallo-hydrolase [bacterium]
MLDKKLLMDLFHIPSTSGQEYLVSEFVKEFLKENGISFFEDSKGNIFNISHVGKPLLSAHMDTVQDDIDMALTEYITLNNDYIRGLGVIGGDDKCGIYSILHLLQNGYGNKVNFIFSVEEEIGGIGASHFGKQNDLTHMPYGLVLDRKGNDNILCVNNDYGVQEFQNALVAIGGGNWVADTGTFSDADAFSEQISCANISVGYYNAHTAQEYVNIKDLSKSINFVHSVVKNLDVMFKAPEKYNYGRHMRSYGFSEYDFFEDDILYTGVMEQCEFCKDDSEPVTYLSSIGTKICKSCLTSLLFELEQVGELELERF